MIHDAFDCQMLVELVTDWLEGALPDDTRQELELHVATCSGCLAYIEQIKDTQAALGRLDTVETASPPPESTKAELLAIFRARRGSHRGSRADLFNLRQGDHEAGASSWRVLTAHLAAVASRCGTHHCQAEPDAAGVTGT
jgi:anti-sigma factor RsiW